MVEFAWLVSPACVGVTQLSVLVAPLQLCMSGVECACITRAPRMIDALTTQLHVSLLSVLRCHDRHAWTDCRDRACVYVAVRVETRPLGACVFGRRDRSAHVCVCCLRS